MEKIKELGFKIYDRINNRMLDYRYKVNKNAGICFSYYLIMSIIPICSLVAFFASLLHVDLSVIEEVLQNYLTPEFASIVVNYLNSSHISLSSIVVLGMSLYVVSRGINQLYGISKNLFPAAHERNVIVEQILMLIKTIAVFVLLLLIISLLTILPIVSYFVDLSGIFLLGDLYLFIVFFFFYFLLYKIIPDAHVHVFDIVKGATVASILMMILLACLQFYFGIADYTSVYGPLASIVVVMISCSLVAELIFIGMYVMFEAHMKRLIKEMKKEYEKKYETVTETNIKY